MKSTIILQLDIEHEDNIPTAVEFANEIANHLTRPGIMSTRAKVMSSAVERHAGPAYHVAPVFGMWHAPDGHNAGRGSYDAATTRTETGTAEG